MHPFIYVFIIFNFLFVSYFCIFFFFLMHLIIIVPVCLLIHFTTVTNDCSVSCADWVLTCINSLSMWSRAEVFRSLLAQAQCLFRLGWRWLSCVHRKAHHPVWMWGGGGGCQRNFGCSCQQYDSERDTKCFDRPVVLHFKFTFYYLLWGDC